jgi:hypothetical protein
MGKAEAARKIECIAARGGKRKEIVTPNFKNICYM